MQQSGHELRYLTLKVLMSVLRPNQGRVIACLVKRFVTEKVFCFSSKTSIFSYTSYCYLTCVRSAVPMPQAYIDTILFSYISAYTLAFRNY